jgi:glycosyltransferase involved in cell wall biosynthesis
VALAWLWKAVTAARGLPRIPNLALPQYDVSPQGEPLITIIVPARNEAADVGNTLCSLLNQDCPNLRIVAVDDRSTDSTGTILDALAAEHPTRLSVLHVTELPAGWLGKTHAMALAARHAIAVERPDYLLFTDADVHFEPTIIRRSLAQAVATQADHFVTFPTPIVKSVGEGALLSYLGVMGLWATRPWRVSDPKSLRDSIGIGAFNLLRKSAYQQVGGFDTLRMHILEDITLARRVKLAGLRQRVAVAPGMITLHWASSATGIVDVMTKNLFAVFRFRTSLALLFCVWIVLFCIAPAGMPFFEQTRVPGALIFVSVVALYLLCSRHGRVSPLYAALFPVAAALFVYSVIRSTFFTLNEGGVRWRGSFYSLTELRENVGSQDAPDQSFRKD